MSTTLYYSRITTDNTLGDKLKTILQKKYEVLGFTKGIILRKKNLDYLQGLLDAGIEDAEKLIEIIEQDDAVEIWIS